MTDQEAAEVAHKALALIRAGNTAAALALLEKVANLD